MQHDVLLGRDSWMRFKDRSYRTLAPRPENNQVLGKLTLSLSGLHGATAFVPASSTHSKTCHLLNAGDVGITLSREHRLIEVDLVRRNGAPALAGCCLVDMLHAADNFSTEEHIVENGRQVIPSTGVADLEPGALLGTSSTPLLRVPLEARWPIRHPDSYSTSLCRPCTTLHCPGPSYRSFHGRGPAPALTAVPGPLHSPSTR